MIYYSVRKFGRTFRVWDVFKLGLVHNEKLSSHRHARYKWVLVVTEHFNIVVNDFDAKKPAGCNRTRCKCI